MTDTTPKATFTNSSGIDYNSDAFNVEDLVLPDGVEIEILAPGAGRESATMPEATEPVELQCSECDFTTLSEMGMKRHRSNQHSTPSVTEVEMFNATPQQLRKDTPGEPGTYRPHDVEPHKISIIGFTNGRLEADWGDKTPGVEVWGLNNLHMMEDIDWDRCERWFDVHATETIGVGDNTGHVDWLAKQTERVIYMKTPNPEIVGSVRFPHESIVAAYGGVRYWTNSISWMLGLAGLEMRDSLDVYVKWLRDAQVIRDNGDDPTEVLGPRPPHPEIGVFGVDMAQETEYGAQRPSCEWIIGLLTGLGYKITIGNSSDLLKTAALYGIEDDGPMQQMLKLRQVEARKEIDSLAVQRSQIVNQLGQLDGRVAYLNGNFAEQEYWLNRWSMPGIDRKTASLSSQDAVPEPTS